MTVCAIENNLVLLGHHEMVLDKYFPHKTTEINPF